MLTLFAQDPLLLWIAAALLATLFAHAAVSKLADLPLTEQHLSVYGLPDALIPLAKMGLPTIELITAIALLTPWRFVGALVACALLLLYASAMAYHLWRGHVLDCGCGGEPLPVSAALVVRNLALAALAVLACLDAPSRSLGLGDFAVLAAAVALGTLLYAALNQILRHHANMQQQSLRKSLWMH